MLLQRFFDKMPNAWIVNATLNSNMGKSYLHL